MRHRRKKIRLSLYILCALALLFFIPQLFFHFKYHGVTHTDLISLPEKDYGILLGALVYDSGEMSPVLKERVDAAVLLYENEKVKKLFVSGTNSHNNEVDVMADYLVEQGVRSEDITKDLNGIKTHESCIHFSDYVKKDALIITQGFHLPRSLYMCDREEIGGVGIAVNHLDVRGPSELSKAEVFWIRTKRFVREAGLTWSFLLGLYDHIPDDAEIVHQSSIIYREDLDPLEGAEVLVHRYDFDGQRGTLFGVKIDPKFFDTAVVHQEDARFVTSWSGPDSVVINGGYFEDDFSPSGHLVVDGEKVGDEDFDADLTGLFAAKDEVVGLHNFGRVPLDVHRHADYALQSFPVLVDQGEPFIAENFGPRARRSAVGVDYDGFTYVIVADQPHFTLFEFMQQLEGFGISFESVLNLDGGPSTGMVVQNKKQENILQIDSRASVPNVILFTKKSTQE